MLEVDVKFSISPDSKSIVIEDDSTGWGTPARTDIDSVSLKIFNDAEHTDPVGGLEITTLLPTVSKEIDFTSTTDAVSLAFIAEYGSYLPDGVYYYEVEYFDGGVSQGSKDDGVFYSTRVIESNINTDLLELLTAVGSFERAMDYGKLENIRRRDNILFAVESAEFLSEAENVETLIAFLQRLE